MTTIVAPQTVDQLVAERDRLDQQQREHTDMLVALEAARKDAAVAVAFGDATAEERQSQLAEEIAARRVALERVQLAAPVIRSRLAAAQQREAARRRERLEGERELLLQRRDAAYSEIAAAIATLGRMAALAYADGRAIAVLDRQLQRSEPSNPFWAEDEALRTELDLVRPTVAALERSLPNMASLLPRLPVKALDRGEAVRVTASRRD